MTNEKAARILDPKTTLEVYAETEYYSGFDGAKRWKEAVDEACIMGANALREQDKQQGKWISVKDRLPENNQLVLATVREYGNGLDWLYYTDIVRYKPDYYNDVEWDFFTGYDVESSVEVFAWQSLPKPLTE
jgi:hypothetical protein